MTREELESYRNQGYYVRLKYNDKFLDLNTRYIREKREDIIGMACDMLVGVNDADISGIELQRSVDANEKTIWPKENFDWGVPREFIPEDQL